MSCFQIARVPKFKLFSLDEVKERLGITQLNKYTEHLTSMERVNALGTTIKKHLQQLDTKLEKLNSVKNSLSDKSLDTIRKAISLDKTLNEQSFSLLKCVVVQKLQSERSIESLQIIQNAQKFLDKGMFDSLAEIYPKLEKALDTLAKSTQSAHLELSRVEQEVLISKTIESLSALGYSVEKKFSKNSTLVKALKNDVSVAAQILDGHLFIDMVGFEGDSCKREFDKLKQELINRGVGLEGVKTTYHGKKSGGILAQKVEKEFKEGFNPLESIKVKKNNQQRNLNKLRKMRQHTY